MRRSALTVALVTLGVVLGAAPAYARPATDYEMPFVCRQDWLGTTRSGHSPGYYSIDWNRSDDVGQPVLAAGSGEVTRVMDLGSSSYGLYVVVDHGGGESTLYAHMSAEYVTVGQRLDQGQMLGRVGGSGGVTGPHLHFEERLDGRVVAPWFHDEAFEMNTTQRSRNCVDHPVAGDWDGDGEAEVGVFRRKSAGRFRLDTPESVTRLRWGSGIDTPLTGDFAGVGRTQVAVRVADDRAFVLRGEDGATSTLTYGRTHDLGVTGDWDGNGRTDLGVYRPSAGLFRLRDARGDTRRVRFGTASSLPVTGDWDGDGTTDLATFDGGVWSLRAERPSGNVWTGTLTLGSRGDLPVAGDWNGDGATDLGVWTPATATFTLRRAAPLSLDPGQLRTQVFGRPR